MAKSNTLKACSDCNFEKANTLLNKQIKYENGIIKH